MSMWYKPKYSNIIAIEALIKNLKVAKMKSPSSCITFLSFSGNLCIYFCLCDYILLSVTVYCIHNYMDICMCASVLNILKFVFLFFPFTYPRTLSDFFYSLTLLSFLFDYGTNLSKDILLALLITACRAKLRWQQKSAFR